MQKNYKRNILVQCFTIINEIKVLKMSSNNYIFYNEMIFSTEVKINQIFQQEMKGFRIILF